LYHSGTANTGASTHINPLMMSQQQTKFDPVDLGSLFNKDNEVKLDLIIDPKMLLNIENQVNKCNNV
jgi:hypothetical protein